jgi:sugar phosphate isomerase/epimerase
MFKIGVDNFSYHRYFGWIMPGQPDPGKRWTLDDFLKRAGELELDVVSLETCFLPPLDRPFLESLRKKLADQKLEGMLSWGHPRGLETGKNLAAAEDLKRTVEAAKFLGTRVLRIVCGGLADRFPEPVPLQMERVLKMLPGIVDHAQAHDIVLAMENHLDFNAGEQVEILQKIDSPYLRVTLDTGNNLRNLEDPMEVVKKLAPYTVATHIKDILATGKGNPATEWRRFWPSVPLGRGIIDLPEVLRILRQNNYAGALNVEIDFLDPRWPDEDEAVAESIAYLRKIAA